MLRVALVLMMIAMVTGCAVPEESADSSGSAELRVQDGMATSPDGAQIAYRLMGSGPDTLVVIHGGPGFTMDYIAADFEPLAARHTLLFYDQRGTGRSTLVTDSAALDAERFVEDLDALRRHLSLGSVNLLGHSWGAAIAALYAVREPDQVGRMLIVDGVPVRLSELARGFRDMENRRDTLELRLMREARAARVANPDDPEACRAYYRLWFRPFFVDTAALGRSRGDFCAGTPESRQNKMQSVDRYTMASLGDYDWREQLRGVQVPTLIIHGDADPIPVETAVEWSQVLPNSRLLVLRGVGHFPYLETPTAFFDAVSEFLGGGWPASATAAGSTTAR